MPTGEIQPPVVGIQDEPTVQICLNREWATQLLGMIYPAQYPEWWSGTLEENRFARLQVRQLLYIISQFEECGDMNNCCPEPYIITRVSPTTHLVEVSSDNGTTWTPQPGGLPTYIVDPVPPVTAGTADNKCDATDNAMDNIDAWITHVTNDFDTATSLLSFASAVLEAILVAVVTILSLGTLTAVEAAVLPIIGAACAAAFAAGKTAFVDYWTSDNLHLIRQAIFCNVSVNGSFTEEGFANAWGEMNTTLPGNAAKNLFLGFLTSVGVQGMNNMLAQGNNSGSDCGDLDCGDLRVWIWDEIAAAPTEIFPDEIGVYTANSGTVLSGTRYVLSIFFHPELPVPAHWKCAPITFIDNPTGGIAFKYRCSDYGEDALATCPAQYTLTSTTAPFTATFTVGEMCGEH